MPERFAKKNNSRRGRGIQLSGCVWWCQACVHKLGKAAWNELFTDVFICSVQVRTELYVATQYKAIFGVDK